jgi:hypothetical protein
MVRAATNEKPGAVQTVRRFIVNLDPKRSVEGSILDGFADAFGSDSVGGGEVGEKSRPADIRESRIA